MFFCASNKVLLLPKSIKKENGLIHIKPGIRETTLALSVCGYRHQNSQKNLEEEEEGGGGQTDKQINKWTSRLINCVPAKAYANI